MTDPIKLGRLHAMARRGGILDQEVAMELGSALLVGRVPEEGEGAWTFRTGYMASPLRRPWMARD